LVLNLFLILWGAIATQQQIDGPVFIITGFAQCCPNVRLLEIRPADAYSVDGAVGTLFTELNILNYLLCLQLCLYLR
jgi:hypothetical protein